MTLSSGETSPSSLSSSDASLSVEVDDDDDDVETVPVDDFEAVPVDVADPVPADTTREDVGTSVDVEDSHMSVCTTPADADVK